MTKGQLTVQKPLVADVRQFFAIKVIAASTRIHCAAAIFHHKLVTTQVAECSRSFSLSLPLGEGRGEGSPMAIPGTELLSGFSNLERRAVGTELSWPHQNPTNPMDCPLNLEMQVTPIAIPAIPDVLVIRHRLSSRA